MVPKQSTSFLFTRALLAIILMIGFYLLAIGIAGLLAYLPIAEVIYAHRLHPKLAIICLISAGIIVWSIIPRFDKFVAPGPKLEPAEHPKFFKCLQEVATKTGQEMPAEVYLCPDVNAWVTQRGGIMGFGSRRVMGVGLPLLQVFTVSEFSAVLAHEFGHYHGGDTKLGPWIYKTRNMIGRTLHGLGDSWIQKPFFWYGKLFLRITHAISRQQEYLADELAARTVSAEALISGLKKVHGAAMGYNAYLQSELAPVLNSGMRAPLCEGFSRYVSTSKVTDAVAKALEHELTEGKGDPYDTHPALKDRVAALERLGLAPGVAENTPAVSLLEKHERYEGELIKALMGDETPDQLKLVSWEEIGSKVYLPMWCKTASDGKCLLKGKKIREVHALAQNRETFCKQLMAEQASWTSDDEQTNFMVNVVGAIFGISLVEAGWTVEARIGEPIRLIKEAAQLEPFGLLADLMEGKLTEKQWNATLGEAGEVIICV